jgi:hypothetical protein
MATELVNVSVADLSAAGMDRKRYKKFFGSFSDRKKAFKQALLFCKKEAKNFLLIEVHGRWRWPWTQCLSNLASVTSIPDGIDTAMPIEGTSLDIALSPRHGKPWPPSSGT